MGNALNQNLAGKVVIFKQEALNIPVEEHPFLVTGGFGARHFTAGTALYGAFISDGERGRMEGFEVDRLATVQEIDPHRERLDELLEELKP